MMIRVTYKFDSELFYIKLICGRTCFLEGYFMKPERSIGYEVKTLNNLIFRDLLSVSSRKGLDELTMMHGWIIGYLYNNRDRDIFQKNLEAEFCISRSTVTNILKLMEKKGYIRRETVSTDARLKKLVLTENGMRMHQIQMEILLEQEERLREYLSSEQLDVFLQAVRVLKAQLKKRLAIESTEEKTERTDREECMKNDKDTCVTD